MTKDTRKLYGKEWAMGDDKFKKKHFGFKKYYDEFKAEIDKELKEHKGA